MIDATDTRTGTDGDGGEPVPEAWQIPPVGSDHLSSGARRADTQPRPPAHVRHSQTCRVFSGPRHETVPSEAVYSHPKAIPCRHGRCAATLTTRSRSPKAAARPPPRTHDVAIPALADWDGGRRASSAPSADALPLMVAQLRAKLAKLRRAER
jgi:hypothetical protein